MSNIFQNGRVHGKLIQVAMLSLVFFARFQSLSAGFQDCSGKLAPDELRRCENLFARKVEAGSRISQLPGGWRLARTPNPRGGPETVSVLHAAETAKSDANFAGLTFRCGPTGIETLMILIEPLARGSTYGVLAKGGSTESRFEAKAMQGGEVLLLPLSATEAARGPWQGVPELSVDIASPTPIHGSVPLSGLSGALSALSQSCPAR